MTEQAKQGKPLTPQMHWITELDARRAAVADLWQAAEDWLDDMSTANADYYIERTICELEKIQLHLKASNSTFPKGRSG